MRTQDKVLKEFCGIQILDMSLQHVLKDIRSTMDLSGSPSMIVVTPNVDHFSRLQSQENLEFNEAYSKASLTLCDSRIIRLISKISSSPIKHVIPGSDLTRSLLEQDWIKNKKICVIGTSDSEFDVVSKKYNLKFASHHNPPMGFITNQAAVNTCLDFITSANPELIFLAVGSPRQEILAKKIHDLCLASPDFKLKYILCIGASFDFLSGKTSRAPYWMQRLHLEWLHRALSDPKRLLPRYFSNFTWLAKFLLRTVFNTNRFKNQNTL
ncbi:UDP-N-acetyl-D-mannosaminuronic acid transferase [compost metagenome]